jgi:hypothetical protein
VQALRVVRLPLLFFIGATLEAPYPLLCHCLLLLAGMGFVAVFLSYSYAYRLHGHGNRTLGIESGLFVDLFYSLFGIGPIGIYHSQIVKAPSIFL